MKSNHHALEVTPRKKYQPKDVVVYTLSEKPALCPVEDCNAPFIDDVLRSGRAAGQGQFKRYCNNCGFIFFDVFVRE